MTKTKTNNPFSEISARGAYLAQFDLRELRTRYCRTLCIPFYRAGTLKRNFMINKILEVEFGDVFNEYEEHCKVWRELEQETIQNWLKTMDLDGSETV